MVETYKSEPFEKRPSQNIRWVDYLKEVAIGLSPFVAAAGAVVIGKLTKQKYIPLDGTPDIFTKMWLNLGQKTAHMTTGQKVDLKKVDLLPWLTVLYKDPADKLRVTHNYWNAVKGFEFGMIPVIFHVWRRQEKKRLDLTGTYDALKQISDLKPTDAELATENASLKKELAYAQRTAATPAPSIDAASVTLDGPLKTTAQQLQA
ncbi:MAG: hypothetical protein V4735_00470 [Pseudomonadota bacterium]